MKKNVKKVLFLVLLVAVISFFGFRALVPIDVSVTEIKSISMKDGFREEAFITAVHEDVIYAPYPEKVDFIVKEGDRVKKGDVLLMMNTDALTLKQEGLQYDSKALRGQREMSKADISEKNLQMMELEIESSVHGFEEISKNLSELEILYQSGIVSKSELESLENKKFHLQKELEAKQKKLEDLKEKRAGKSGTHAYYQAQLSAIDSQLEDVQMHLKDAEVICEKDAIVSYVSIEKGGFAQPYQPLIKLISTDDLKVVCNVLTERVPDLKKGQRIKVIQNTKSDTYEYSAEITYIEEFAHSEVSALGLEERRVKIEALLEKDAEHSPFQTLKAGYDVDVEFQTFSKEDVISIKKNSYFEEDGNRYVWKVDGGRLKKEKIETGYVGDFEVEVLSGLREKDIIVSDPNDERLEEGKRISY